MRLRDYRRTFGSIVLPTFGDDGATVDLESIEFTVDAAVNRKEIVLIIKGTEVV